MALHSPPPRGLPNLPTSRTRTRAQCEAARRCIHHQPLLTTASWQSPRWWVDGSRPTWLSAPTPPPGLDYISGPRLTLMPLICNILHCNVIEKALLMASLQSAERGLSFRIIQLGARLPMDHGTGRGQTHKCVCVCVCVTINLQNYVSATRFRFSCHWPRGAEQRRRREG